MTEYQNQPTVMLSIVGDPTLLRGVLDACLAVGWRGVNLVYTSNYVPSRQPPIGVIIDMEPAGSALAETRKADVPIVSGMNHESEALKHLPGVLQDRRSAGRMAAAAFAERGFRNIGYLEFSVVDAVARHVDTSRSTLERSFRRCLGRGVGAELRRKRLERSRQLLRGTNMTVAQIVKAVGLADKRRFRQAFARAYGLTPQKYRRQCK